MSKPKRKRHKVLSTFLGVLADLLNKHWILKQILIFLPSVWLPFVVKYFGQQFGLIKGADKLTGFGYAITTIIYIFALLIATLSNVRTKKEQEKVNKMRVIESTVDFYSKLLASLNEVNVQKCNSVIELANSDQANAIDIIGFLNNLCPKNHLKCIANEIRNCFYEQTGIGQDKLIVSMAYCLTGSKTDEEWKWVDRQAVRGGLPLSELTTNKNTIFYQIMTGIIKSKFIYINDKTKASGQYVFDSKDTRYRGVGSIVSTEISVEIESKTIARLILSVSSYSKKISTDEKEEVLIEVENNIQTIFGQFEEQIRTELTLLYLKEELESIEKDKAINKIAVHD